MKRYLRMLLLLPGLAAVAAVGVEGDLNLAPEEIGRLTLAVALVDYPVGQVEFRKLVGLPDEAHPGGGEGAAIAGDPRGGYLSWHLRSLPNGGSFVLKAVYNQDSMATTGHFPLIIAGEVTLSLNSYGEFVADPNAWPLRLLPRFKAKMKRDGLTPAEFTAPKNFDRYRAEVLKDMNTEIRANIERQRKH